MSLQCDVSIPDVSPHGHAIGVDVGLSYFLSTSDGEQVGRPRTVGKLQRKRSTELTPKSGIAATMFETKTKTVYQSYQASKENRQSSRTNCSISFGLAVQAGSSSVRQRWHDFRRGFGFPSHGKRYVG